MRVIDYLKAKYGVHNPTTILYAEGKVFGIKFPLQSGWLQKYGSLEITPDLADKLKKSLAKLIKDNHPRAESAQNGLQVLEDAYLQIKTKPEARSNDFLQSKAWQRARIHAFKKYGNKCQCCGATAETGVRLCVDHIKPRRLFPELALDLDNLQVLCFDCNSGKGNWDMTDWRNTNKSLPANGERYTVI
jgi:5-methylcytosine-specific restriction endonuclease McrA